MVEIEDETPWLLRGSLFLLAVGAVACLCALNANLPRHLRPDILLGSIYALAIGGVCLMVWIVRQRKELDRRVLLLLEGSINKALDGKERVGNRQVLDSGQRSIAVSEDGTRLAFTAVMKETIRSVAHEDGPYVFDSQQIVRAWVEKDKQTIITTNASGASVDVGGIILGGSTARSTARTYTTGLWLVLHVRRPNTEPLFYIPMPDDATARKWWALAENVILSDPNENRKAVPVG